MHEFRGKVAVVTGAASGIGLASAHAFAREGMDVALLDLRAEEVRAAADAVRNAGVRTMGIVADVADAASVASAADQVIREFGKVHLLMNNAAVFVRGPDIETVGDEVWEWLLGVNLYGPIHCIRSFLPHIRVHGEEGHIVNTASISGLLVGARRNGVYATSKFALVALSEAVSHDLAGSPIQVSVLLPGGVSSEFYETSALHRGALGGPNMFPTTPPDNAAGMSPHEVAERMLEGVRANRFYIVTHSATRAGVVDRHESIMSAYDAASAYERLSDIAVSAIV